MVIVNDLEWPMLSYYVIYYEKFRKSMMQTEKVALIILDQIFNFSMTKTRSRNNAKHG